MHDSILHVGKLEWQGVHSEAELEGMNSQWRGEGLSTIYSEVINGVKQHT